MIASLTPDELDALSVSLRVAGLAVAGALPVAIVIGAALARPRLPGRILLDALANFPLVMPPVVVGFVLLALFGVQGPIGAWLEATFGIRLVFTTAGAALAAGVMALPVMIRAVRQGFEMVDPGLMVAARSLGAGPLDRFATIALPLVAPAIVAAGISGFAVCLGAFGAVITFAASVPGETRTLPLALYAALQAPDGEAAAWRLAGLSMALAVAALLAANALNALALRRAGRTP